MRINLTVEFYKKKQQKAIQLLQVYLKLAKIKFLLFFHFSDLRNLVKCMGSIFKSYSLLNMKVI